MPPDLGGISVCARELRRKEGEEAPLPFFVITGLDPVIHVVRQFLAVQARMGVDDRDKPGHDETLYYSPVAIRSTNCFTVGMKPFL